MTIPIRTGYTVIPILDEIRLKIIGQSNTKKLF